MRICEDVIVDYDEDGYPIYEQQCYDDGSTDTSVDDSAADADLAGGLLTPDALGAVLGKDNIDYDAWMKEAMTPEAQTAVQKLISSRADPSTIGKLLNAFKTDGKYDWAKIATAGAGLYNLLKSQSSDSGGYNVPVPKMDMVRQQVQFNDPNRRPGSTGRQYFTDPRFVKQGDTAGLAAAQAAANTQAQGILAANPVAAKAAVNPYAGKMALNWNPVTPDVATAPTETPAGIASLPVVPTQEQLMDPKYKVGMASGGIANARYLRGGTDGMADELPASIDGDQKAALSHGEFVIPADVVSHLGNGNSDAGADKLYQMMDRIRQARTGTKKQGKKINPDKFMPGGLAAAYAGGGEVKGYNGTTGSAVATSAGGVPLDTSKTSSLSPWAGDYVTNFLGQGAALANAPMQTYGGPLTAGASDLQQQGFAGISETAAAGYKPTTFTSGTFDTAAANKYMNPYVMAALNPQIEEARRQSQITQQQNAAKMTQAGAFGGSRQAILDAETQRALGANLANITGTGLNTAYDKAMAQFNAEQNRGLDTQRATESSRQYSADYGLKSLSDLLSAGQTQRNIEQEGLTADKAQFEQQQAYPFNMVEFQRKLVEGLPIGASTTAVNQDALSKMQSDVSGLASLYKTLANLKLPVGG
jgi:hypothetical protein